MIDPAKHIVSLVVKKSEQDYITFYNYQIEKMYSMMGIPKDLLSTPAHAELHNLSVELSELFSKAITPLEEMFVEQSNQILDLLIFKRSRCPRKLKKWLSKRTTEFRIKYFRQKRDRYLKIVIK